MATRFLSFDLGFVAMFLERIVLHVVSRVAICWRKIRDKNFHRENG